MSIAKNLWRFVERIDSSLCSSMRSAEGKGSKRQLKEQSAHCRMVPQSCTITPNGPECDDAEGKHEMAMKQKKGESPSHLAASTNFAERSASALLLMLINTKLVINFISSEQLLLFSE
uniref:Uncharacterized protein n=1 Tax=Solanum tuberosum TaxID=4113 RepID=M1DKF0_SOLTU